MRLSCFHVVVKHALAPETPEKDLTRQGVSIKNGERRFTGHNMAAIHLNETLHTRRPPPRRPASWPGCTIVSLAGLVRTRPFEGWKGSSQSITTA